MTPKNSGLAETLLLELKFQTQNYPRDLPVEPW